MLIKVLACDHIIPLYEGFCYLQVFRIYLFDFLMSKRFLPKTRLAHMQLRMLPYYRL